MIKITQKWPLSFLTAALKGSIQSSRQTGKTKAAQKSNGKVITRVHFWALYANAKISRHIAKLFSNLLSAEIILLPRIGCHFFGVGKAATSKKLFFYQFVFPNSTVTDRSGWREGFENQKCKQLRHLRVPCSTYPPPPTEKFIDCFVPFAQRFYHCHFIGAGLCLLLLVCHSDLISPLGWVLGGSAERIVVTTRGAGGVGWRAKTGPSGPNRAIIVCI